MRKFWFGLWSYWAVWLTLFSTVTGALLALVATLLTYLATGGAPLNAEIWVALGDLFLFWFGIGWSMALLLGLLLVVKRIFYRCIDHYQLHFVQCPSQTEIRDLQVGDTVKLWRKWLLALIWVVAVQMILVIAVEYLFGAEALLGWFSIYWLYVMLMIAGAVTLPLMGARCKSVRVKRC